MITDDLYALLENGDSSVAQLDAPPAAHRGIASKADLLGMVRHLAIEYPEPRSDFSYEQIMLGRMAARRHSRFNPEHQHLLTKAIWNNVALETAASDALCCNIIYTAHRLDSALDSLRQRATNGAFPLNLSSLCIGAQMGGYSPAFANFHMQVRINSMNQGRQNPKNAFYPFKTALAQDLVRHCGAKHFCFRSSDGYLGVPSDIKIFPDDMSDSVRPHFTTHMQEWLTYPALELRTPATLVHERPFHHHRGAAGTRQDLDDSRNRMFAVSEYGRCRYTSDLASDDLPCDIIAESPTDFTAMLRWLAKRISADTSPSMPARPKLSIRVYGSSVVGPSLEEDSSSMPLLATSPLNDAQQLSIVKRWESSFRARMGSDNLSVIDFSMDILSAAPVCKACGV